MSSQVIQLRLGDSIELLKGFDEGSIGALVSDPPYGLEFMDTGQAAWKYKFGKEGQFMGALPSFNPSRNCVCRNCHKHKWGAKKCQCEAPDFDDVDNRIQDRQQFQSWCKMWLTECYRVLAPGGVAKVFGGSRMYHRAAAAMADVGFKGLHLETWMYGSGFPKSMNVCKAIASQVGVEPPVALQGWATALKPGWEPFMVGYKRSGPHD